MDSLLAKSADKFFGNSIETWALALALFLGVAGFAKIAHWLIQVRLTKFAARTETKWDDYLCAALKSTKWPFFLVIGAWSASQILVLPEKVHKTLLSLCLLILFIQIGVWLSSLVKYLVKTYGQENKDAERATTINALGFLVRTTIWITVSLLALDNFGINVSALIAGLGIGGIAIALAVQNILGDLLASLSIVLDKPFVIGDTINVDQNIGTVEHIGLKTTRVKSATGEQLIFSNSDLLKSRIRNLRRMQEKRITVSLGVSYETAPEVLTRVPLLVEEIVKKQPLCRFERCLLSGLADSAINFELIYWVANQDFSPQAIAQHEILLQILAKFRDENISFAYPTRTLKIDPLKIDTAKHESPTDRSLR